MISISSISHQVVTHQEAIVNSDQQPKANPVQAVSAASETKPDTNALQKELSLLVSALLKNEFKHANRNNARQTVEQRLQRAAELPKKTDAAHLTTVLAGLAEFADAATIERVVAFLSQANEQGADATVAALRTATDMMWTPKSEHAVQNSTAILATPREGWSRYHYGVKRLVQSLAGLDRRDILTRTTDVIRAMPPGPDRDESVTLMRLTREMVFFNVTDRQRVGQTKTLLESGVQGGLSTLQEAVTQLRSPRLDARVDNAATTFAGKSYVELTSTERRLGRVVTFLQLSQLPWAESVKDVIVPERPLPPETESEAA